jgi:hypothetical protein
MKLRYLVAQHHSQTEEQSVLDSRQRATTSFPDDFMRIFDTVLLLALLCLAVSLIRLDVQEAQRWQSFKRSSITTFEMSGTFQFIEGRDENGAFIFAPPARFRRLVFFVLHGSRFQRDVDFWNAARQETINPGDLGFVGVCDGPECSKSVLASGSGIHFTSVNSGDYLGMKALLRADADGQILVMGLPGGKMRKSAYPKSLAEATALRMGARR